MIVKSLFDTINLLLATEYSFAASINQLLDRGNFVSFGKLSVQFNAALSPPICWAGFIVLSHDIPLI